MERRNASDFPRGLLDLFHEYQHGRIDRRSFLNGASALIVAIGAIAAPVPPLDVGALVAASDIVAVGTVTFVTNNVPAAEPPRDPKKPGQSRVATLELTGMVKGSLSVPSTLTCRLVSAGDGRGYGTIPEGAFRMFFLSGDNSSCRFTSAYYPSLPAVPGYQPQGDGDLARAADALGAVLDSSSHESQEKSAIAMLLGRMAAPNASAVLRRFLSVSDENVKVSAATALLYQNDLSGLPIVEQMLRTTSAGVSRSVFSNARAGVAAISNPSAVSAMGRLLQSPDPLTRRASADALRSTKAPSGIQYLVRALDDSDQMVQYTSVMALAEITGELSENAPSIEAFRTSPDKFIRFWKQWAEQRRSSK